MGEVRTWAGVLALALAAAACGDDDIGGPGNQTVEAVVISGVPAEPLLVGGAVQLIATAVNGTGGLVSGAQVSWSSSDPSVASVSRSGRVEALAAGTVTITASAGRGSGEAVLDVRGGGAVGPHGGTLVLMDGAVRIEVPPGGLGQTTLLLVRPAQGAPASPRAVGGSAYEITPETARFTLPAQLTLRYDRSRVPPGLDEGGLQLYSRRGEEWELVRGSGVNVQAQTVTGRMVAAGTYAILSTPIATLTVTGSHANGALIVSQTAQLRVRALDAFGDSMPGRTAQWSSSDAARVRVDPDGTVTALAPGSATITARVEDRTATTTILAVARPVANWSGATDWTTWQGNARRTGHVPVTADPLVFRELWTASLEAGDTRLNPVTAAQGRVFVSTNMYFTGRQRLHVLSTTGGTPIWSKDFGDIHSVHPPAFGLGNVYLTTGGHEDSYLYAFDAATGAQRFRTRYGNQWSRWYAPAVVGQSVYMAGGYYGGMYAFDALAGAQQWFTETNQYDEWTPAIADGRVFAYTGNYQPALRVADAATGAVLYEIADPEFAWDGWSMNTTPVVGSLGNVVATQGGRLLSFDLAGRTIAWSRKESFRGTVSVAAGRVYAVNGSRVDARREQDGALIWSWQPPAGTPGRAMVVTDNLLLVSTLTTDWSQSPHATYAVDLASGRQVWSHPVGGHLSLSDDILFIARSDGRLTAVQLR